MRKQKTLAIIAACVLATSCPYAVTAGEIEKQEVTTEVYASSEDVICSGDCSKLQVMMLSGRLRKLMIVENSNSLSQVAEI